MHMSRAEYRIQNTESGRSNIHTFCGILYAPARSRMHAGPSNIQFPRLLEDSVCSGKIQNARRTVQHTVSTPFGGFCMLRQDPKCTPDRPTYSFHAFWGILYAPAGYRMRGAGCKDTGNRRLQQNPRFFRIQNPGLQILFPLPQPRLTQLPGQQSQWSAGGWRGPRRLGAHVHACAAGSRPWQQGEGRRWAPRAASVNESTPGGGPGPGLMDPSPNTARIGHAGPCGALGRSRPLSALGVRLFNVRNALARAPRYA